MQAYLLSAVGVIFISVVVSLLIPDGKLNKTIVFVMRLIGIFVLIQPIKGIFHLPEGESAQYFDSGFVAAAYSENQSRSLERLLAETFSAETECRVDVGYEDGGFKVRGVEVQIAKDGDLIEEIYAYLEKLGYINISVYAESA